MEILNECLPHQNINQLKIIAKNSDYRIYKFKDILVDETRKVKKIKKGDYLDKGVNPIIDQSKKFISGYTDCNDKIYKNYPFILFGDHTRVFKYIDFESYLGADGAKIVNLHENYSEKIDIKYIYYFLKSIDIPDTGYNRHFKYVRGLLFPIPPMEIQKQIVQVLDQAQALIDKRKEQIETLDQLIESIFYDMFGNPMKNEKGWETSSWNKIFNTTTGKLNSNAADQDGKYPFFTCAKEVSSINTYAYDFEALLLAGNNASADYDVKHYKGKFNAYQRTYILTLKKNNNYLYFKEVLENYLLEMKQISKGTNTKYLTLKLLSAFELPVPPLILQNEFAEKVQTIEKQKELLNQSLQLMEESYKSIMDKAFKGQLFKRR